LCLATASDEAIRSYAAKTNAVIVTKDEDFADRRVLQEGPAVVWVRIGNTRRAELLRRIEADFSAIVAALERGEVLVEIA
jgi:predicted nuclease of predicted toxin-antitoxin system